MSNQYFNFYYDPTSQGFDPLSWRSLYGTPVVSGTKLSIGSSTIIHLANILRGDFVFNVNIPAPSVGDDRQIGLIQYNKNAYIYFNILDDVLTAETSDGVTSYSTAITWQGDWSSVDTDFRIKWEAGAAKFYIGGALQATISYSTTLDVPQSVVPGVPLSFYFSDYGSSSPILLKSINATDIQSYLLLTSNSSVTIGDQIEELDRLTITESVTVAHALAESINKSESITISESASALITSHPINSIVDSLTLTDIPTVSIPDITLSIDTGEDITISESLTMDMN